MTSTKKPDATKPKPKKDAKPDPQFEEEWAKVQGAFDDLLASIASDFKYKPDHVKMMHNYTIVYNMCVKSDPKTTIGTASQQILFNRAKAMVERYLDESVTQDVNNKRGEELLTRTHRAWNQHQLVVRWLGFFLRYLDEYYTRQQNCGTLRMMMLKCFHTAVYEKIRNDLCEVLLQQVQKERDGVPIEKGVMKDAVGLFVEMGMDSTAVYETDFQTPFLAATAAYYKKKASQWLSEPGGIHLYLRRAEASLMEESKRAMAYLHPSSREPLTKEVENELLKLNLDRVLNDTEAGTEALLVHWKTEDLKRMYVLFRAIDKGLQTMSDHVREYIKKEGKEINKKFCEGDLDQKQYIDGCLELHVKYTNLFLDSFDNDPAFHKARKEAYEVFINEMLSTTKQTTEGDKAAANKEGGAPPTQRVNITTSELLSSYCDNLMKSEKITPDELEDTLTRIVDLFMYISDKDLFAEVYRRQMSRRLLVSKTDNDNERQVISKLKMKMGAPYTSKLEGMINDKNTSADTQKKFIEWYSNSADGRERSLPYDFSATVLTTGFWPAFKIDQLTEPPELKDCLDLFNRYYTTANGSRVLKWVHSLGTANLLARFAKQPKELSVSTFQASILLLFNTRESIKLGELANQLSLPVDDVKRTLFSMSSNKLNILKRAAADDKKKVLSEDDEYSVNDDFTHPQRRIKIPNVIKQTGNPVQATDESRRHVIEACIVRVMKARKTLSHAELVSECIRQLRNLFIPDPRLIKKRIEDLIQRAYLERSAENQTVYRYLA